MLPQEQNPIAETSLSIIDFPKHIFAVVMIKLLVMGKGHLPRLKTENPGPRQRAF